MQRGSIYFQSNIASEHVSSALVTGKTAATFSSFETVSQLIVKECILNSAPKSCDQDPLQTLNIMSRFYYLTDLFDSSLSSGIFPQFFKSALVTPILKKRCLDHNDLNNYRPVYGYALLLIYWKNLSYPKFLPTSTLTIFTILVNQHIFLVTA